MASYFFFSFDFVVHAGPVAIFALASYIHFLRNDYDSFWAFVAYAAFWSYPFSVAYWHESHLPLAAVYVRVVQLLYVYLVDLWIYMAVYRLFLHRICHIPGPISLASSKLFWILVDVMGENRIYSEHLHSTHGDMVRIGPREVSINDPGAIDVVLDNCGPCGKGPRLEIAYRGLLFLSHRHLSLEDGEARSEFVGSRLVTTTREFMQQLEAASRDEEPVNVGRWSLCASLDALCSLAYSKNPNVLNEGPESSRLIAVERALRQRSILGNVPYFGVALRDPLRGWNDWIEKTIGSGASPNVLSCLFVPEDHHGNVALALAAAAAAMSEVVAMALYHLVADPSCYQAVRNEVFSVAGSEEFPSNIDQLTANDCPMLNAVIDETMRLHPPLASVGLHQRVTPPSGLVLPLRKGNMRLPPNVVVTIPLHVIQRDARNFSPSPDNFHPRRWFAEQLLPPQFQKSVATLNKVAYLPFGRTSSPIDDVAYMHLRIVIATFVHQFDARFPPEFNKDAFLHSQDTSQKQSVLLLLSRRRRCRRGEE